VTYAQQITAAHVNGVVLTLGAQFDTVAAVEILNTGNYPNASAVAPETFTVVSTAPASASQVQLTAPNQLTFYTGTTFDTTYGTVVVTGHLRGQIQKVA